MALLVLALAIVSVPAHAQSANLIPGGWHAFHYQDSDGNGWFYYKGPGQHQTGSFEVAIYQNHQWVYGEGWKYWHTDQHGRQWVEFHVYVPGYGWVPFQGWLGVHSGSGTYHAYGHHDYWVVWK
jgi:hypothetical protein